MARCYSDDEHAPNWPAAEYEARVAWTCGPMLLCANCAARERATGDVIKIRNIKTTDETED